MCYTSLTFTELRAALRTCAIPSLSCYYLFYNGLLYTYININEGCLLSVKCLAICVTPCVQLPILIKVMVLLTVTVLVTTIDALQYFETGQ